MLTRRWIDWLLCCILVSSFTGYTLMVFIVPQQMRKNACERLLHKLPAARLTPITIPYTAAAQLEEAKDKELNINGRLYDVLCTEKTAAGLVCYCINDSQEEAFFRSAGEFYNASQSTDKPSDNGQHILKQYIADYIGSGGVLFSVQLPVKVMLHAHQSFSYISAIQKVSTPPPRQA